MRVNVTALKDSLREPDVHQAKMLHVLSDGGEQALYVDIVDADQSGVLVTPRESRVFEGQSFAYQVQLCSQPTSNVVVEISASSHLSVSIEYLTFTPENWAQPQTVRVKSLEDNIDLEDVRSFNNSALRYIRGQKLSPHVCSNVRQCH